MFRSSWLTLKIGDNDAALVDASLVAAPSSTKNEARMQDPEMHQTKKGNQWYFGMKGHIGVDRVSGLNHSVRVTAANVHDLAPAAELLRGDKKVDYGDASYQSIAKRPEMAGHTATFRVTIRPESNQTLPDSPEGLLADVVETTKLHIRSNIEHAFRAIKQQSGFQKSMLTDLP